MQTRVFTIHSGADAKAVREVADILKNGGVVAIPTETVYGLAANALDAAAVEKIFAAKGRPQDNPLIVHVAGFDDIRALTSRVPARARELSRRFWPGPLTMVLPKANCIPDTVSGGLPTVAVRMPAHPAALAVIQAAGVPLAAPSANLSGGPSPTTAAHVLNDLDGLIDAVVDGGECAVGVESTVVSLLDEVPRLLRPGGITPGQLREVLGNLIIDPAVYADIERDQKPSSPGMKYKHYSPRARLVIVKGSLDAFREYVETHEQPGSAVLCFEEELDAFSVPCVSFGKRADAADQARQLFDALRRVDALPGVNFIFARHPETEGMGLAVYNRLLRAAAFEVITL